MTSKRLAMRWETLLIERFLSNHQRNEAVAPKL
jgi:hypothetical protein